jgi:hypothetical protein
MHGLLPLDGCHPIIRITRIWTCKCPKLPTPSQPLIRETTASTKHAHVRKNHNPINHNKINSNNGKRKNNTSKTPHPFANFAK